MKENWYNYFSLSLSLSLSWSLFFLLLFIKANKGKTNRSQKRFIESALEHATMTCSMWILQLQQTFAQVLRNQCRNSIPRDQPLVLKKTSQLVAIVRGSSLRFLIRCEFNIFFIIDILIVSFRSIRLL